VTTMQRAARALARWLLRPVLDHLDAINRRLDAIEGRLTALSARLDEVEELVQVIGTRATVHAEGSLAARESEARTARRVEQIERLLGAAADHH
jgi:DNA mismatch repair ATPase MutS